MQHLIWAKRHRGPSGEEPSSSYHPLICHCLDVAAVTELLWKEVLKPHFREVMSRELGLEPDLAGKCLAFLAGLHDLGKATPVFQGQWEKARQWLEAARLSCPLPFLQVHHGILTTCLLVELLPTLLPSFPSPVIRQLAFILGGHHGIFPRQDDVNRVTTRVKGGKRWQELQAGLIKRFAELWDVSNLPLSRTSKISWACLLKLAGLVSVADWIGSNEEYFPFASPEIDPKDYLEKARRQAQRALHWLGWLGWNTPSSFLTLPELFPVIRSHGLRPIQAAVSELGEHLTEPGLVIVEAPMGEGKTEAAMYLADRWALALGQKGCYFALPTMATSNQMFIRVQEFLRQRYPKEVVNLQLLHGHASLAAEFQALRQRAERLFVPANLEADEGGCQAKLPGEIIAAEWFTHKKRGFLAPFGVGTVDQILLAALHTRHYFVRLFGLAHKTVIVDEVHAYDAYMVKLLERLLEWLAAMRCSVVLLSATLPQNRRLALMEAYCLGLGKPSPSLAKCPYPRVSWITSSGEGTRGFAASPQFSRKMRLCWHKPQTSERDVPFALLGQELQKALAEGGCAAVICNTVGRAQEVYLSLKEFFPAPDAGDGFPELDLFHARYLFENREERETRVLQRFGKPGSGVNRPQRAVLVATQVIEQSLDLDFDLMVTEMAPVDLLLQRAGRLHRHQRTRPVNLQKPTLILLAPELQDEVPRFDPGTANIYYPHLLLRTWWALRERREIAVPEGVEELIEVVYGDKSPPADLSPGELKAWQDTWKDLDCHQQKERYRAQNCYIFSPCHPDDLWEGQKPELEEDDPAVHRSLQALTRWGDPSVSLVFLYEKGDEVFLEPGVEQPVALETKPEGDLVRALLQRSVSITHRLLVPWLLKEGEIPTGWRRHPLLCRHRLIRLNPAGRWQGGGFELSLDPELGVVITSLRKESS